MDAPLAPRDAKLQSATNQAVRGCRADGDSGNSVSTESDVPRKARILGIAAREPNLLPSGISEGPVEPCAKFISRPPPPAEGIAPSSSVRNGAISRVSVCIADPPHLQRKGLRQARRCATGRSQGCRCASPTGRCSKAPDSKRAPEMRGSAERAQSSLHHRGWKPSFHSYTSAAAVPAQETGPVRPTPTEPALEPPSVRRVALRSEIPSYRLVK